MIIDNVCGVGPSIVRVETPRTLDEVRSLVIAARTKKEKLYPYSTGLNWGYGSKSPVTLDNVLVDLSGMNKILNADDISIDNPVAVIEPGVTQEQLANFLSERCPSLTFNVTGSSAQSSILGCSLDRGVGYFGPRKDDLFGLELVTGTGEVLKTGYRRLGENSPLAHAHPYGLGPIVDGLFFQGNFGIVTSACFRLLPRRPVEVAVSLALRSVDLLPAFIDELAKLKREGLLTSVTHIGNKARTHSTLMYGITTYLEGHGYNGDTALVLAGEALSIVAPDEWTSLAAVTGNRGQVLASIIEIKRRMRRYAGVRIVTEGILNFGATVLKPLSFLKFAQVNLAAIATFRPLHRLAVGHPTNVPIDNLLWKYGAVGQPVTELDRSRCGLLFINPALPLNGRAVTLLIKELETIAARYQHTLYMTLNIETSTSMVAVINLLFDRTVPEEVERAHRCADALLDYICGQGLEPYRLRADMMHKVISSNNPYWQTIRRLKSVFDPDNIIAPGRYNLAE